LLGVAAIAAACTPFNVLPPDGGDATVSQAGGSGGTSSGTQGGPAGAAGTAVTSHDGGVDTMDALTTSGSANGAACTFDTDCRFGHCVEGVCCDGTCAGKCVSCRGASTGGADGKCAPVTAGLVHGTDCTASE